MLFSLIVASTVKVNVSCTSFDSDRLAKLSLLGKIEIKNGNAQKIWDDATAIKKIVIFLIKFLICAQEYSGKERISEIHIGIKIPKNQGTAINAIEKIKLDIAVRKIYKKLLVL